MAIVEAAPVSRSNPFVLASLAKATSEYDLPSVLSALQVASMAFVRPSEVWELGSTRIALNKARMGKWEEARSIWEDKGDEIVSSIIDEICRTSGEISKLLFAHLFNMEDLELRASCCLKGESC